MPKRGFVIHEGFRRSQSRTTRPVAAIARLEGSGTAKTYAEPALEPNCSSRHADHGTAAGQAHGIAKLVLSSVAANELRDIGPARVEQLEDIRSSHVVVISPSPQ